jgi:dihydroneopterin aldolase
MAIGAYASEIGRTQRVRFSVEAEIARAEGAARDMRDIVSYDLITDAIKHLALAGHVELVETLAEGIAERVLAHPRVLGVRVVVEKLDVGPGSVGVEIRRDRADLRAP